MKWNLTEVLFASILVAAFIFVVAYYFCLVNNLNNKNVVCRFLYHLSARSVIVLAQAVSIVLGCLGCQVVSFRFVPSPADISLEEWNIFLFAIVYNFSWLFILCGGRIIAKKFRNILY